MKPLRAHLHRGFTLLFAVLIGSLLFTLGISISNIALKEIVLSAAGKNSERAFFSADTGTECALYWDIERAAFPDHAGSQPADITCAESTVTPVIAQSDADSATSQFTLSTPLYCAVITVAKTRSPVASTVIESRGRSDCGSGDDPARVERALRVTY